VVGHPRLISRVARHELGGEGHLDEADEATHERGHQRGCGNLGQ
jgi:hypothetical protein